ncbi:SusC/RagA family TonB-linked outer membrane protein [Paradesertivirga mongoliensis]|uniref:SusC/RagA family TonB-linked outer membrane protein n=1 Tax=Paradesertivirga mongoliensis TaxID=2100740 RepID=A0ABW4ZRD7_9SPHI|nr:SusC/RagA family TonB-linked outer membrane protein [Pedobacter mongoliensis]
MQIFKKSVNTVLLAGFFLTGSYSVFAQQTDSLTQSQTDSVASITRATSGPRANITILDASSGAAVPGARITVAGYSAAISDDRGKAMVSVPNLSSVISITAEGFQYKEIALKGKLDFIVKLHEDGFNTVYGDVTLPSGPISKTTTPFAVSAVRFNDPVSAGGKETPDTYLQGKLSGLNVVRRSGTPSIGANMFLRGVNSFYTSNQPLIVVDGMIYNNDQVGSLFSGFSNNSLENIDIKDIEDVSLVKDAGAALYGTKGGNGVLFITTRRPNSENTKIDFSSSAGFNSSIDRLPVMDAYSYRSYLAGVMQSSGQSNAQIYSAPYMRDSQVGNLEYYKYHMNTDWHNQVFNAGYNQNYHMNVSGGDNIAKYNLSLGYVNNAGAIKSTSLDRYFTRFNADFNLSRKFSASTNLSFSSSNHKLANQGQAFKTSATYLGVVKAPFLHPNVIGSLGEQSPNLADTDIFGVSNPAALIEDMDAVNTNYRVIAALKMNYNFSERLSLSSQFGVSYDKIRDRLFIPQRGVSADTTQKGLLLNTIGSNTNRLFALFNDTRFSYQKNFNNIHKVDASIGARLKQDKYEADLGVTYNSSTDDYRSLSSGSPNLREINGGIGDMRWLNTYANVDYSLFNRYLLSLNLAVDGSSRFGRDVRNALTINGNKLAVMPAVGAAWLVSSENFMANVNAVDLLKLRLSYGVVGNDDIGNYTARSYYVTQNLFGLQGYARGNVGNTALQWETIEKLNGGLDLALFNERLNLSVDIYRNNAKNLLMYDAVNPVTGFDFSVNNSGGIETNGVDLSLNSRILDRKFKWDMAITISSYRNKVTRLASNSFETNYGGATILTRVGSPVNLFYGYKSNGVYSSTAEANASGLTNRLPDESIVTLQGGDVRFVNMNGDAIIDSDDRVVIGNPNPDFTGMFGNSFNYRNWSLNAMFTFSYGNDVYNGTRNILESMSGYQNQLVSAENRWRADGHVTNTPRAALGDPAMNSRFSDRWIEDGSYLRMRNLALAYNFRIKSEYFKTLRVYGSADNLVTFSKYLGYDPEFSATTSVFHQGIDVGVEPQFRTIQIGVKVGL